MSEADRGYKAGRLYSTPSDSRKWVSPYDFSSEELDVLQRRNLSPTWTGTFTLNAQTPTSPQVINQPGRAFAVEIITTATLYNPTTNAGIETRAAGLVGAFIYTKPGINQGSSDPAQSIILGLPATLDQRGYRGDFQSLGFFWPQQDNNTVRITIFRYDGVPWMP